MHHKETALLGRIVAEAAHDLNNVLAVTRDGGGLLGDILKMAGDMPYADKLKRIVDSIDRQTKRGAETAKALNQFAHLADEERAESDLATLADLALILTRRFASQRRTEISFPRPKKGIVFTGPVLRVLLGVVACLRACIDACAEGKVEIDVNKAKPNVEMGFTLQGAKSIPDPAPLNSALEEMEMLFVVRDSRALLAIPAKS